MRQPKPYGTSRGHFEQDFCRRCGKADLFVLHGFHRFFSAVLKSERTLPLHPGIPAGTNSAHRWKTVDSAAAKAETVCVQLLWKDIQSSEEGGDSPADPHGRKALQVPHVRQELFRSGEFKEAPEGPHGGETVQLRHLRSYVRLDPERQKSQAQVPS